MIAAVAAGHPATADAGAEILAAGGTAADAAVAACLASCVAETVMTGLLGGGHAIYFDAAPGRRATSTASSPSVRRGRADGCSSQVPFGEELVHYAVGASSCAVPGVPAGLDALWRAHGRLPWPRLVEPALRLARDGRRDAGGARRVPRMLAPVMTMREGARDLRARQATLLAAGDRLEQPGLVARARAARATRAPRASTRARSRRALLALVAERGGAITARDLARVRGRWGEPAGRLRGHAGRSRAAASRAATLAGRSPRLDPAGGAAALLAALDAAQARDGHTTNLGAVDADGQRVRAHDEPRPRLGRLAARARPAPEQHARRGRPAPRAARAGERMESMMAPTLALDGDGARARDRRRRRDAAAHGARRRRSRAILDEGLDAAGRDRPRRASIPRATS